MAKVKTVLTQSKGLWDIMRLFQKIFKSNKGLSLLELIVAIAFLAIVITPVMNSFITAGKINAKSRKLMCANDCAQSIMEGIADKSFFELASAYSKYGSESVSASFAMSGLNDNAYNVQTCSTNTVDTNVVYKSGFTNTAASISVNNNYEISITQGGGSIITKKTATSISENGFVESVNAGFRKDCLAMLGTTNSSLEKHICIWANSDVATDMDAMMITYGGIEWDGYYFDAVVTFIPEGKEPVAPITEENLWFSYYVQIDLYEVKKSGTEFTRTLGFDNTGADTIAPVLSLNTGIKNN